MQLLLVSDWTLLTRFRSTCIAIFFDFLLAKPVPAKRPWNIEQKNQPYTTFRDNHQSILLHVVSKRWRDSAKESINFDILTPQKLAGIKSKVFALNLSSIREVFIKLIKIQWPPHLKDIEIEAWMTDPLSTVLNHFDKLYRPESFAKIVEDEYKHFLVISVSK